MFKVGDALSHSDLPRTLLGLGIERLHVNSDFERMGSAAKN
jgi:hypothetical protein